MNDRQTLSYNLHSSLHWTTIYPFPAYPCVYFSSDWTKFPYVITYRKVPRGSILVLNTTTIITAIITGFFTVLGTLGGILLSNRHTRKMEEIKLKQEKAKRTTQNIEEVYQTLLEIEDLCVAFAYDVRQSGSDLDTVGRIKEIRTNLQRVKTLIWLYLPQPIILDFNEHMNIIQNFEKEAIDFYAQKGEESFSKGSSDTLDHLEENLTRAQRAYEKSLHKLQGKLERLVE